MDKPHTQSESEGTAAPLLWRHLAKFRLPQLVFRTFYASTIEILLAGSLTAWFGNAIERDLIVLLRVLHSAEHACPAGHMHTVVFNQGTDDS